MMSLADQALYAAKAAGKGRCILHAADVEGSQGGREVVATDAPNSAPWLGVRRHRVVARMAGG